MLTYVCGLLRGVEAPHNTARMRQHGKLRILMSGIAISRRFRVEFDDFQIFIKPMVLHEKIHQKLLFVLVFGFWNDF